MKLSNKELRDAYNEVTRNHREALGEIVRRKGDKEDYQKLYGAIHGWYKL